MNTRPRRVTILLGLALSLTLPGAVRAEGKARLFILSGQSNMQGLKPERTFTPVLEKALGDDEIIVVKSAQGGQPIRRWFKKWKPEKGPAPAKTGDLYERLLAEVRKAMGTRKIAEIDTITFVWMQGERDANEGHGKVYAKSLRGLIAQLKADLERRDVDTVIGRLSDFSNGNRRYRHWDEVRAAQVEVAKADARIEWVDTDAFNGPKDDLHYTREGYDALGRRFAQEAIRLLDTPRKKPAKTPAAPGADDSR